MRCAAILALLLSTCTPTPFEASAECMISGAHVYLQSAAGCDVAVNRMAEVGDLLVSGDAEFQMPGVVSAGDLRTVLEGVAVWVFDDQWSVPCGLDRAFGCTDGSDIKVFRDMGSLAHELIHRWIETTGRATSEQNRDHYQWLERGYLDLDGVFMSHHPPMPDGGVS